jgi:hypothetical protein
MQDSSQAANAHLANAYGIDLPQLLADATLGRVPPALRRALHLGPARRTDWYVDDENGGVSEIFEGTLALEDVTYNWSCAVVTDRRGARSVSHVAAFVPVEWKLRLLVDDGVTSAPASACR